MGIAEDLAALRERGLAQLAAISEAEVLEEWRTRYLGRRGELTQVLRGLGALPPEERPAAGAAGNRAKEALEAAYDDAVERLRRAALAAAIERERVDVTLPGRTPQVGQVHPTTRILREITAIFARMGFDVADGPEVEWDYYNFEALNIPPDHPARDMWDTFYVDAPPSERGAMLLRTHTSPMQIRVMDRYAPPVRVIVPGKVYRYEAISARHESMFYQVEGFAVDRNITMADLKGTLARFARALFGEERRVRFRCDYFPFVEPGAEMAIDCHLCNGAGCRLCSQSGWIEILGAGMIHPKVLQVVGYDPGVYSGFAFGMGPERIAMLKYGIETIRLFYANDLRFLRQLRMLDGAVARADAGGR
ncbi:MAG: phenylalanine--tRNA ligase subunit alpha [Chloroflexi bacterium]|nr:phenylalanine--tRNA ligase subunit alpha [Chloroflexota bacterium]